MPQSYGIKVKGMFKTFTVPGWGGKKNYKFTVHKVRTKIDCPKVDAFLSYKECLVFGDFDHLPRGYDSWDHHFNEMSYKYSHVAYFFRSFSGKTKCCIKVRGYRLSKASMIATLGKVFGEDAQGMDHNDSALRTSFLLPEYFKGFGLYATNQEPIQPVKVNTFRLATLDDGFMPEIQGFARGVLAFACSFKRTEMDLPQNFVADTIGCAPSTARAAIDRLTMDEVIRLVDSSVIVGRKGFTFQLAPLVIARLATRVAYKTLYRPVPLTLTPGNWYFGLWNATNFFSCMEDFLEWVLSHSGVHCPGKGRYKMALNAWNNHVKCDA